MAHWRETSLRRFAMLMLISSFAWRALAPIGVAEAAGNQGGCQESKACCCRRSDAGKIVTDAATARTNSSRAAKLADTAGSRDCRCGGERPTPPAQPESTVPQRRVPSGPELAMVHAVHAFDGHSADDGHGVSLIRPAAQVGVPSIQRLYCVWRI